MANSGIEIEIYKDSAPFDKIGIIEARKSPTALREIRANGAGSFQVRKDNPKVQADPTLLDYRNLVRVRLNGQCVGGFVLDNKKHVIVGEGEKAEEVWSISGEGFRSGAKAAVVRPAKGVSRFSRETRYFNFASEQGSWYNSGQWSNAVVVSTWGDSVSQAWRGTAPADWPDAPTAKWIWDRTSSGGFAMPQGYVYFRKEFTLAEAGQYALFFAVDDAAEVYMDGELIHTTAEHAWQETTRQDVDLDSGNHVLAFRAYNYRPDGPGAVISAFYKIGNASSPTAATQMFVSDATWKIAAYPAIAPGWTIGNILLTLMDEAEARGIRFAANWTPTFSNTNDSAGVAWGDPVSVSFDVGSTNYVNVFETLESMGCDIWVDPETLNLHAYKTRGVDRSITGTEADPIILRIGHNLRTADESGQADIVNTLLLNTSEGWSVETATSDSITKYGVIEGQISTDMTTAQAASLVGEVFGKKSLPEKTATFELIPVPGMVPWENFFEGDYVSAPGEVPGVLEKRRIMSISATENESNGNPVYAIEFDAIFGDRTSDLEKMLSQATHSSALGGGFTGTTGTPSTVTQGSNPSVPVSAPPEVPTGLVVQTVGRWADNGSAVSDYGLTWNAVIANVNGLPVTDIEKYEVWGRKNPDTVFALRETVFDTFAYLKNFNPGESWSFRIRAISRTGGPSMFSSIGTLTADAPVVPLGTPSTPTLISELGSVVVKWDGLIGGVVPPNRFKYMKVVRATSSGGTYTMVASMTGGSVADSSGVVGTAYWYKLIPVDYLGVEGAASAFATITVAGVSTSELDSAINDAINGAVEDANNAVIAANGKNKITFSTSLPGSTVGIAGDLWYRRDGTGKIIAIFENMGGATWTQRTMTEGTVSDLSAGVLTTGFLAADRISANSIQSEKLLIGVLDNFLDNPYWETGAFEGWTTTGTNWVVTSLASTTINKHLTRTATTAGSIVNNFKVQVRKGQRMRLDFKNFSTGTLTSTQIGVQWLNAAGAQLSVSTAPLTVTAAFTDTTAEYDVPDGAYFARFYLNDPGTSTRTIRIANPQFRLMGAGQLLVDGVIQGRHVAANTIEGESLKIGTIEADRISANASASLDLSANGSINLLVGGQAAQAETLSQQQAAMNELQAQTNTAQDLANAAATTANDAATVANGLQAGIEETSADLAALGTTYRFTPTGAFIGSPGSPYEFVIQNNGAEIRHNGVPTTSWDSGRMIAPSFIGSEVVLGSHKLESDVAQSGTVVRKI